MSAPATGLIQARLTSSSDWDVAVFDAQTGRFVAASAGFGGNELAEGFVTKGQRLIVQACRIRGRGGGTADVRGAGTADVQSRFYALPAASGDTGPTRIVDVRTRDSAAKLRLQSLGLDLTEHGDADSVEVVLHGDADAGTLRRAGFRSTVRIPDLQKRVEAGRVADAAYAARTQRSRLPSGRTTYRHLADYDLEMKQLALTYPALVRPITLNHKTIEGREVNGIEITTSAADTEDGKPIFLQLGGHHAREWPASEHAIEFAHDLLNRFGRDRRTTRLLERTRTIVVPVVNPDGFNISREAPPIGDYSTVDYEMKRKNCAISGRTPQRDRAGVCSDNPKGRLRGTDPNRNYGGFWGGVGASTNWSSDVYRGDAPFSEPEVQNIRELVSARQVTNLITNHTYSNLVLRPPGAIATRPPLDEPLYKALGQRMADHNKYSNVPGHELYETTGTTEDWTFWSTGGFGFTFEIGPSEFHPPYRTGVVAEYLGLDPADGAGLGGNRAAYYEMLEATADSSYHAVIKGKAPPGSRLRLHKEFTTTTSPVWQNDSGTRVGQPIQVKDVLDSTYLSKGGAFAWHVNPSTRPLVAGRYGRDPQGPAQATITLRNPAGVPAANAGDPVAGPHEAIPFTVKGPPRADNGRMIVHIEWRDPVVDWDLYVLDAKGRIVAQSASFGDNTEDAVLVDPPAGDYTAIVVNSDGGDKDDWTLGEVRFGSPDPMTIGPKEAWTLTCEQPDGTIRTATQVTVDRGHTVDVGRLC